MKVIGMYLRNVAMIALSACESGLGRVENGDEVLGFTRSFLSAGTSTLLASLWPVSDAATEKLMTTLYAELAGGPYGLTQRLDKEGQAFGLALSAAALTMISTSYGIWQAWWMCGILSAALMLYLAARTPLRG